MRNKVIKFLSDLPAEPVAQFNQALQLYLQTPGHNTSVARYHNSSGYSAQRLTELMYDLKATHEITPADIIPADTPEHIQTLVGGSTSLNFPQFSKGTKGNHERRAYAEEHGIESASNKNDDLDAAITEYLGNQLAEQEKAKSLEVDLGEADDPAGTAAAKLAFDKIISVLRAGESVPESLVRELYADEDMTDEQAAAIIKEAKLVIVDPHSTDATAPFINGDKAKTKDEYISELAKLNTAKEAPSEEFLEGMKTTLELSDEDFKTFMGMIGAAAKGIDAALEKVLESKKPATKKK